MMPVNKHITDLTDEEIKDFIHSLNEDFKLLDISRNKAWDEVTCQIRSSYWIEFNSTSLVYEESKLVLTDPYDWDDSEDSLYTQYGEDALEKWKQFCFSKEIYPVWMLSNPYTKTRVLQFTDEQLELIQTALDFMQTKIIERDGECGQDASDLLNYLKQFGKQENE